MSELPATLGSYIEAEDQSILREMGAGQNKAMFPVEKDTPYL